MESRDWDVTGQARDEWRTSIELYHRRIRENIREAEGITTLYSDHACTVPFLKHTAIIVWADKEHKTAIVIFDQGSIYVLFVFQPE